MLYDGDRVVGVRTGDRGIGKHGERKSTFEPGVDIRAKVTILTDGVRGNLTKALVRRLALDDGRLPQLYAIGIKELWEVPQGPHRSRAPSSTRWAIRCGWRSSAAGSSTRCRTASCRSASSPGSTTAIRCSIRTSRFQHFKRHPLVASLLDGGQMVRYGAKALPEGGWHTIPRVYADGVLIAGDAGGFLNSMRLKGIHLAMRTGMLAAETAFEAVRAGDTSAARSKSYEDAIDASDVRRELYPVRNVHQSFELRACSPALAYSGLSLVTGGWWFSDPMPAHAGYERMREARRLLPRRPAGSRCRRSTRRRSIVS